MDLTGWSDSFGAQLTTSMATGLVTTTATAPVDIVKSRVFVGEPPHCSTGSLFSLSSLFCCCHPNPPLCFAHRNDLILKQHQTSSPDGISISITIKTAERPLTELCLSCNCNHCRVPEGEAGGGSLKTLIRIVTKEGVQGLFKGWSAQVKTLLPCFCSALRCDSSSSQRDDLPLCSRLC